MLRLRILTATILGTLLLAALFLLRPQSAVWVFGALFTLGAWEWGGLAALQRAPARLAFALGIAALLAASWVYTRDPVHLRALLSLACLWWLAAFLWLTLAPARQRPVLILLCAVPVLVPAFAALARLQVATSGFARGPVLVLLLLLLVFAADIGAYFAGRALGRRKLAPRVSPGKTWEGAVGGLAAVALIASGAALYFDLPLLKSVGWGCAVGIFSIVGDLTESMFKRSAGLKDSGSLLPGHGGILDRMDSLSAAAPLYALGLFGSRLIA